MYAVVEIAGQQYRVNPAEKLYVSKLDSAVDSVVTFDKVRLRADDKRVTVGNPVVKGASVVAKVLAHSKADKVIVFKRKRRKGCRGKRGVRQQHPQIAITSIT